MSLALDHVLNPDHDALKHPAVFEGADGAFFCVHCAAQRQVREPKGRIMFADKSHRPARYGGQAETTRLIVIEAKGVALPQARQLASVARSDKR